MARQDQKYTNSPPSTHQWRQKKERQTGPKRDFDERKKANYFVHQKRFGFVQRLTINREQLDKPLPITDRVIQKCTTARRKTQCRVAK